MVAFTSAIAFLAGAAAVAAAPVQQRGSHSGQATYFYQGGVAGACGTVHSDSSYVVAIDSAMYDGGAYCGKTVKIVNEDTGASVTAKVADECPTCASAGSLDLSVAAFEKIASLDAGVAPISWSFVSNEKRGEYSGQATYFYQGGNAGACGNYNSDSSYVVAIDSAMYDGGAYCGKTVKITNSNTGASVTAKVADECPTCASSGSLDLSVAAFEAIATLDEGVASITWSFE